MMKQQNDYQAIKTHDRQQSCRNRLCELLNPCEEKTMQIFQEIHEFDENSYLAFGKSCTSHGIRNHFSKICHRRRNENSRMVKEVSSDSGDSVYTVSTSSEFPEDQEIYAV